VNISSSAQRSAIHETTTAPWLVTFAADLVSHSKAKHQIQYYRQREQVCGGNMFSASEHLSQKAIEWVSHILSPVHER
jgi:hypothetical protein